MKSNNLHKYIAVSLALLIPVPGRFGYGIMLIILLNLLMCFGTLFRSLLKKLSLEDFHTVLISIMLIFTTVLFRQLMILVNPVMALTLGVCIYLPAACSFLIGSLYKESTESITEDLTVNMKFSGIFSIFASVFFLFRDIFGYGTLTFPGKNGLFLLKIFPNGKHFIIGNFWASIPGALVLCAVMIVLISWIMRNINDAAGRISAEKIALKKNPDIDVIEKKEDRK